GQGPPGGRILVGDETAARGNRGRDSRLRMVRRHPDVEVDPVDLRVWRFDLLEPDGRPATAWVDQILGAVFAVLVRKHGPPERLHLGDVKRVDRDKDRLHCRGVGGDAQLARDRRDLSGQLEIALAKSVVIGRDRDQPHDHAVVPQVNVRVVVIEGGQLADCLHEPGACRERPGAEVRARSFAHHAPILHALGIVEPPRCDRVNHALNITCWTREWTHAIRRFTGQGSSSIDMAASGDPASSISSATQRREFLQGFGTRAVYLTSLAPRNSARFSIVSRIFNATSLSSGAPGSAWIELITSLSFSLSIFGSTRPMNRSPHRMGSTLVPNFRLSFGRKISWT